MIDYLFEKPRLFEALLLLKEHNIDKIEITYSGGGDSGAIDDLMFYKNNTLYLSETLHTKVLYGIEELIYKQLENVADWYNDEGGYGMVSINLDTYDMEIENNVYYTETVRDLYGSNLFI